MASMASFHAQEGAVAPHGDMVGTRSRLAKGCISRGSRPARPREQMKRNGNDVFDWGMNDGHPADGRQGGLRNAAGARPPGRD